MQEFLKSYSFILAFLIAVAISEASVGEKITSYFLILVLISMLIINADIFVNFLNGIRAKEKG